MRGMSSMQSVIEYLIEFGRKNHVIPSITFLGEIGSMNILVKLRRGSRCIERIFYYVPVGEDSVKNFRFYNPSVDLVLQNMVDKLSREGAEE